MHRAASAVFDATGNRFLIADVWRDEEVRLDEAKRLGCDGVLELGRPDEGCDVGMVLWNLDGGRARFCGNGLRCIARAAIERGYVRVSELRVRTDSGPRRVRAELLDGRVVSARAEMGAVGLLRDVQVDDPRVEGPGLLVDVGNLHLVLVVRSLAELPLEEVVRCAAPSSAFPDGVNVECVEAGYGPGAVSMRVHERGVGETLSCGSGATAAAVAMEARLGSTLPVTVRTRGGDLRVERDEQGIVWTGGAVTELEV